MDEESKPKATPSWHSGRYRHRHPTTISTVARMPNPAMHSVDTESTSIGRALALSVGLLLLSAGSQIALAKGWTDLIPDWAVIALYLSALIPLSWWAFTHKKLLRHRVWLKSQLIARPYVAGAALLAVVVIVCIGLTLASVLILAKVKNKAKAKLNSQPTPPIVLTPPASNVPVAEDERNRIIDEIVSRYKQAHSGKSPTIPEVNRQLKEMKQNFFIFKKSAKVANHQKGIVLNDAEDTVITDPHVVGTEVGIEVNRGKGNKVISPSIGTDVHDNAEKP